MPVQGPIDLYAVPKEKPVPTIIPDTSIEHTFEVSEFAGSNRRFATECGPRTVVVRRNPDPQLRWEARFADLTHIAGPYGHSDTTADAAVDMLYDDFEMMYATYTRGEQHRMTAEAWKLGQMLGEFARWA